MRFWNNLDKLKEYAAAKGVAVTDLTIQEARKAITKPKPDSDKGKPAKVVKGGVAEPGNATKPRSIAPDKALEGLANDEVFGTLRNIYQNRQDELRDLTEKLA